MERQVRILFSDRIDILAAGAGIAHELRSSAECAGFNDVDASNPIDEVDQSAIVGRDIVGRGAILAVGWIWQKMVELAGSEGIRDVDETQSLGEPCERSHGAVEPFRWLMAAAHRRLWTAIAVEPGHLKRRDRQRLNQFRFAD
jgi:hypothetical protein